MQREAANSVLRWSVLTWVTACAMPALNLTAHILQWRQHPIFAIWIKVLVLFGYGLPVEQLLDAPIVRRKPGVEISLLVLPNDTVNLQILLPYYFRMTDVTLQCKQQVVTTARAGSDGTPSAEQPLEVEILTFMDINTEVRARSDEVGRMNAPSSVDLV